MTKLDALMQTESTQTVIDALCEAQDDALMQILAMARLARTALDDEKENATTDAGFALDAIMRIAGTANADLDAAQIALSDARLVVAARAAALSPFGRVQSIEES